MISKMTTFLEADLPFYFAATADAADSASSEEKAQPKRGSGRKNRPLGENG